MSFELKEKAFVTLNLFWDMVLDNNMIVKTYY